MYTHGTAMDSSSPPSTSIEVVNTNAFLCPFLEPLALCSREQSTLNLHFQGEARLDSCVELECSRSWRAVV